MTKTRLGYTLLLHLLLPYALFHLWWRGRRQPEYLRNVAERFGRYPTRPVKPVIWLHAVSVGETRAAAPLVNALLAAYPDHQVLLTHMTPTGRETGESLFGDRVLRCYLPYDFPWAVQRFLRHFRPRLGLLMETEIWFNLIHACRPELPLLLVNARMSEKSARKYGRFGPLTAQSLQELAAVAAQTEEDAGRLRALGASPLVCGNLKFDVTPPPASLELGQRLRERFGRQRPVLLFASTREGEEALILDLLPHIRVPGLLTVIVPRHPQRFDEVARLIGRSGLAYRRRSDEAPVPEEVPLVLGDSMGEMFAYYAACDAAFIGGSLLPFGAQNLIEACAVGKPVLIGPHTYNFKEATEQAIACGAARRVPNASALAQAATAVLTDRAMAATMGLAGQDFAQRHQGATRRLLALAAPYLAKNGTA